MMSMNFKSLCVCSLMALGCVGQLFAAEPTLSVAIQPRYPWNGNVDVQFTIGADETEGGYAAHEPGDDAIAGYRLKYVQSAGDAQLNTGVVPGSKNTIELKFAFDGTPASQNQCLYCARGATTATASYTCFLLEGRWRFDYNSASGTESTTPTPVSGVPMVIRTVAGSASVDGVAVQSYTAANFTVGGQLALFSSYVEAPGTRLANYLKGKIYYLKIFGDDGTTLLHDFVPWEKDGVVGMYDTIAARFVAPNVGTLTCGTRGPKYDTSFTAKDVAGGTNLTMKTLYKSNGAAANPVKEPLLPGNYSWVWDAQADLGADTVLERVTVTAETVAPVITYSVKFNANGGTGTMANESFTLGTAKALTANAFTRTGYTFDGWATSATGAKAYTDKQSVSDLTTTAGATVNLYAVWTAARFMVIDLSGGSSATSYPITYLSAAPSNGFTNTTYRTTKLVLRRLEAGSFKMQGSTTTTLSKPYYVGVFEVTQKQWSLVMGSLPSGVSSTYGKGDGFPVNFVSYSAIRGSSNGAKWPSSSVVDSTSFLGKLRARTNIDFDLPTEAQWERACRAGTTTTYYWGSSINSSYCWYDSNSSSTCHIVGLKKPNAWGLYDMSGNLFEWCLDWYGSLKYGTDPKGPSSGTNRHMRGGSWNHTSSCCTSSYRCYGENGPSSGGQGAGFRLCLTLQ